MRLPQPSLPNLPDLVVKPDLEWRKNSPPLGFRNNNPMNVLFSPRNPWKGLVGATGTFGGGGYCVFIDHEHGMRAALLTLRSYVVRHQLRSVYRIVSRWAPHEDNPTPAYIRHVAGRLGVDSMEVLPFRTRAERVSTFRWLCTAMTEFELGQQPFTEESLRAYFAKLVE